MLNSIKKQMAVALSFMVIGGSIIHIPIANAAVPVNISDTDIFSNIVESADTVATYYVSSDGDTYLSNNFQVKEFACKDGSDKVLIDSELVRKLQMIRDHFAAPLSINSGYRSPNYNSKVGGAKNSYHTKGQAADIVVKGVSPSEVAKYAESIGMYGIGLYDNFTHVDTRSSENKFYWKTSAQISVSTFGGKPIPPDILAYGTVATESSNLNIRSDTSTSSSIVGKAPKGSELAILEWTNDNWLKVSYNGTVGYCSRSYVNVNNGNNDEKVIAYGTVATESSNLNIRSDTNTSSSIIGKAPKGSELAILEWTNDNWLKVSYNGTVGYCSRNYIAVASDNSNENSGGVESSNVVSSPIWYEQISSVKLGDEFYAKIKNISNGLYLTNTGSTIAGSADTGNKDQIFKFQLQSDGSYKIISLSDGYPLDVAGGVQGNDIDIRTWYDDNATTAQRFFIYYTCDAYYIRPLCSDRVIDMSLDTDDHNISTWAYGYDHAPQKFDLQLVSEETINTTTSITTVVDINKTEVTTTNVEIVDDTEDENTETAFTEITTVTEKKIEPPLVGDANCDGEVNMADAVLIMQSLANPDKYGITAQGKFNADTNYDGVTNADALAIQKKLLGLL